MDKDLVWKVMRGICDGVRCEDDLRISYDCCCGGRHRRDRRRGIGETIRGHRIVGVLERNERLRLIISWLRRSGCGVDNDLIST